MIKYIIVVIVGNDYRLYLFYLLFHLSLNNMLCCECSFRNALPWITLNPCRKQLSVCKVIW